MCLLIDSMPLGLFPFDFSFLLLSKINVCVYLSSHLVSSLSQPSVGDWTVCVLLSILPCWYCESK